MLYKTGFALAFLLAGAFAKVRTSTGPAHSPIGPRLAA